MPHSHRTRTSCIHTKGNGAGRWCFTGPHWAKLRDQKREEERVFLNCFGHDMQKTGYRKTAPEVIAKEKGTT